MEHTGVLRHLARTGRPSHGGLPAAEPPITDRRGGLTPWCDTCPLRALSVFEDFKNDELQLMLRFKIGHRNAARGGVIVRNDEPNGHLFTVFSGWALRHRLLADGRRQITQVILPGDTIGLDGLFLDPPPYSVQAVTDITFCVLDPQFALKVFTEHPQLSERLMKLALIEQRSMETRLAVIGRCNAEERLAFVITDVHDRLARRRMINGEAFRFPITQHQLADLAGLNTIHTNRVLRRFRERDIMVIENHRVEIKDFPTLRRLASLSTHEEARPLL